MRATRPWAAGVGLGLALVACAGNTAPAGFLVPPRLAQTEAYGGWVELLVTGGARVDGELIAVTADSVWVLGTASVVVPVASVRQGKLTTTNAEVGNVAGATGLGVVSTISNGILLVFTMPLWIIVGTAAGSSQSYAPERRVSPLHWAELNGFARFPQGLPDGVSLASLRAKPRRR